VLWSCTRAALSVTSLFLHGPLSIIFSVPFRSLCSVSLQPRKKEGKGKRKRGEIPLRCGFLFTCSLVLPLICSLFVLFSFITEHQGSEGPLSEYKGKVALVVNVASQW